ncbi:winged helix-turn-helix transcriptional regulator [Candidatus Woesearchaeota archaeon]|nr:winged helix-turn-helix transcriptional regulator [Candidatus Woesearchaeota archaeon]
MDKTDKAILDDLDKNSRQAYKNISKSIEMTEGAVRHRVSRLQKRGILKKFTIDYKGKYSAILCLEVSDKDAVAKELSMLGIDFFRTNGRYDFICMVKDDTERMANSLSLEKKISNIDILQVIDN